MKNYVGGITMVNWLPAGYYEKDIRHFNIIELSDDLSDLKIILEIQIPTNMDSFEPLEYFYKDCDQDDFKCLLNELCSIFPKYLSGICKEHDGIERMNDFPSLDTRFNIVCSPNCIGIKTDFDTFQFAGCRVEDVGKDFTKNFVAGLYGMWEGISF